MNANEETENVCVYRMYGNIKLQRTDSLSHFYRSNSPNTDSFTSPTSTTTSNSTHSNQQNAAASCAVVSVYTLLLYTLLLHTVLLYTVSCSPSAPTLSQHASYQHVFVLWLHGQKQVQHFRQTAEGTPGRPWRCGWETPSAVTGSTGLEAAETGQVKISAGTRCLAPACWVWWWHTFKCCVYVQHVFLFILPLFFCWFLFHLRW